MSLFLSFALIRIKARCAVFQGVDFCPSSSTISMRHAAECDPRDCLSRAPPRRRARGRLGVELESNRWAHPLLAADDDAFHHHLELWPVYILAQVRSLRDCLRGMGRHWGRRKHDRRHGDVRRIRRCIPNCLPYPYHRRHDRVKARLLKAIPWSARGAPPVARAGTWRALCRLSPPTLAVASCCGLDPGKANER